MLRGIGDKFMGSCSGGWVSKKQLLKDIAEEKLRLESEVKFWEEFESEGSQEIIEDIADTYRVDIKNIMEEYTNAKKL